MKEQLLVRAMACEQKANTTGVAQDDGADFD
jgi:hypothetical protein